MADPDVLKRVMKVTGCVLGLDFERIRPGDNFVFDLGAESVQSVELVAAFEEEFGVEIPDEAAEKIATVKDANEFLKQNLAS